MMNLCLHFVNCAHFKIIDWLFDDSIVLIHSQFSIANLQTKKQLKQLLKPRFKYVVWIKNVLKVSGVQCDQMWRFLDFGQLFKAFGNN